MVYANAMSSKLLDTIHSFHKEITAMRIKTLLAAALSCALLIPAAFAQDGAKPGAKPTATPAAPKMGSMKMGDKKMEGKTTGKKMPARDPKTGRFVKKDAMSGKKGGSMVGAAPTKKMPARDPKTGRFVKKDATAPASAPAKKP